MEDVAEMVVEAVEAAEAAGRHCRHVGADFAAFPVVPSRICSCLCKLFELFELEVHGAVKGRPRVKFSLKILKVVVSHINPQVCLVLDTYCDCKL